ncbi:hypothetical protein FQP87_03695 [Vibrio tasmaniensis]|nr:hypothetical protein FQP87_03695 [Vibrio tasmaniensis]
MINQPEEFSIIDELRGLPMVDKEFQCQLLLSLITHHRSNITKNVIKLNDCVYPKTAGDVYDKYTDINTDVPTFSELGSNQQIKLAKAIETIKEIMPHWEIYFSLPIDYRFLSASTTVSLTNHCIPQTIFLGEKAFTTSEWLEEVIVHEIAHVWMGMICELRYFHDTSTNERFTLPSGTKNKDVRGVIFAGHFAAAVLSYFEEKERKLLGTTNSKERIIYLKNYLKGCLDILTKDISIKRSGSDLVNRLKKYEEAHG